MREKVQTLGIVARLLPLIVSREKTSTIRWKEDRIVPGPMRYLCDGDPARGADVFVTRCTDMRLAAVAKFLCKVELWPDAIMLAGMREHYPEITLSDIVQVIEHEPFAGDRRA